MKDLKVDFETGIVIKNKTPSLVQDVGVYLQNIKIEAVTVEGDLWHNPDYGWSLIDFVHRNSDEMLEIEISQRVKDKLSNRLNVDESSIKIELQEYAESMLMRISFLLLDEEVNFQIAFNRVKAEVVLIG